MRRRFEDVSYSNRYYDSQKKEQRTEHNKDLRDNNEIGCRRRERSASISHSSPFING